MFGCRGGDCCSCTHAYGERKEVSPYKKSRAAYFQQYNMDNREARTEAQRRWRQKKKQEGRDDGKKDA